jgi:hypothetical protein
MVGHYARFHTMPAETIERVTELAGASIASCPWRLHEHVHEGGAIEGDPDGEFMKMVMNP